MDKELRTDLKTAQVQILAPMLQESLALLAAPILEVQTKINEALEKNPALEREDDAEREAPSPSREGTQDSEEDDAPQWSPQELKAYFETEQGVSDGNIGGSGGFRYGKSGSFATSSGTPLLDFALNTVTEEISLQEYLRKQVREDDWVRSVDWEKNGVVVQNGWKEEEFRTVLETLIGYIDDLGYLREKTAALVFSTGFSPEQINFALSIIHDYFDPPGIGATDLRQCLLIQLKRKGEEGGIAWNIVKDHLKDLSQKRFEYLCRSLAIPMEMLIKAVLLIRSLEPKPGRPFFSSRDVYAVPDVFVSRENGKYIAKVDESILPKLRINKLYKELIGSSDSRETRSYIQAQIRSGKGFITALEQRSRTLQRVAQAIVSAQEDFMEHGAKALKPLTMTQIAEAVSLHETTISRSVSGKYIQTPQGLFPLKYFFSTKLSASNGSGDVARGNGENAAGEASAVEVRTRLREFIQKEDKAKPLSDSLLEKMFHDKGITVSRRTIAKYRAEMGILPSAQRRNTPF